VTTSNNSHSCYLILGEFMIVPKFAVALLAAVFLGAGLAAPAHAVVAGVPPEERAKVLLPTSARGHAELAGPGGSFGIEQIGKDAWDVKRAASSYKKGADEGELLLSASVSDPADASRSYTLTLPESSTAEVITNDAGEQSVLLLNRAGELLGGIASGDTTDANGTVVPTSFSVEGVKVTQTLNPRKGAAVAYPVYMTAAASTVWYSSGWVTTYYGRGYIVNAVPTALGRQQIAWNLHYIHVQHLKTILGTQAYRVNYNIEQQFVCHVVGAFLDTGVYNMESWQPSLPWQQISNPWDRCNRIK